MNVILNITTTPTALPTGVIAGLLSLSLTDASGKAVNDTNGQLLGPQQVSGTTATFANVGPGDYLASAVRLDTNGTPIGAAITQAFTVPAPAATTTATPTYDAPQSVTVTLA